MRCRQCHEPARHDTNCAMADRGGRAIGYLGTCASGCGARFHRFSSTVIPFKDVMPSAPIVGTTGSILRRVAMLS